MNQPEDFTLVCDIGIDDLVALMVLTGAGRPPSHIVATAGNADLVVAVRNTVAIAELLGIDARVVMGCGDALDGPYPGHAIAIHGHDALGGITALLPAVSDGALPAAAPLDVGGRVLATAPLTPIAHALRGGQAIDTVTWMGGACEVDGNTTATSEFNAWLDPVAADEVLGSGSGAAMVPLDVTDEVVWSPSESAELAATGRLAHLAMAACDQLRRRGPLRIPDAVAAVAFLAPELFTWRHHHVRCTTGTGPLRGMTTCVAAGSVAVGVGVDADAVKAYVARSLAALP